MIENSLCRFARKGPCHSPALVATSASEWTKTYPENTTCSYWLIGDGAFGWCQSDSQYFCSTA